MLSSSLPLVRFLSVTFLLLLLLLSFLLLLLLLPDPAPSPEVNAEKASGPPSATSLYEYVF